MNGGQAYSLTEIGARIGADDVQGCSPDSSFEITGLASLASAGPGDLSFINNERYLDAALASRAAALICSVELASKLNCPRIIHSNPYLGYARASAMFARAELDDGVHPSAQIADDATLGTRVSIGANVVIGSGSKIGDGCTVGPNTVIGDDCDIGSDTRLCANVSLYQGIKIGRNCLIHSGAVIGADGFGFAPDGDAWIKIHQLGAVRIGDDVEVGANSCIDRGALDDTVIEDGVRIDDLVMIAHNVRIGANSALAGQVGIAGSTEIGRNCTLAGNVGLVGHIRLTDNVHVTGKTMITSSIERPGSYSSGTPYSETKMWRRNAARFNNLDRFAQRLQRLEKK